MQTLTKRSTHKSKKPPAVRFNQKVDPKKPATTTQKGKEKDSTGKEK